MFKSRHVARAFVFALMLGAFSAVSVSRAYGQDFSLTSSVLHPVNPGGSSSANLDLQPSGGFNSAVSLSCTVMSSVSGAPVCDVSPTSATPPAQPSLNVTTSATTPAGTYQISITGTSGSLTHTITESLGVTPLSADYILSVLPTTASPSPVTAGNSATSTVTVTPLGTYSGSVTLSCLSISPVTTVPPVCSFQATNGSGPVVVTAGVAATATITITTLGPFPTTKMWAPRLFYALWLALPGLALVGAGRAGKRRHRLMGLLFLMAIASGLLLMPACGSTNHTNNPNGETTPKNTYTFTLTGVDQNGASPSNTTTDAATVSVTVD
jgi:hypothetical protein